MIGQVMLCENKFMEQIHAYIHTYMDNMFGDHIPVCCGYEIFSGGLEKSTMLARLIPHLKVGAQK